MTTTYMTIKVREGLDRIARERPDLDFGVESPAVAAAEMRLNEAMHAYTRDPVVTEAVVRDAFRAWEYELVVANQSEGPRLFAVR